MGVILGSDTISTKTFCLTKQPENCPTTWCSQSPIPQTLAYPGARRGTAVRLFVHSLLRCVVLVLVISIAVTSTVCGANDEPKKAECNLFAKLPYRTQVLGTFTVGTASYFLVGRREYGQYDGLRLMTTSRSKSALPKEVEFEGRLLDVVHDPSQGVLLITSDSVYIGDRSSGSLRHFPIKVKAGSAEFPLHEYRSRSGEQEPPSVVPSTGGKTLIIAYDGVYLVDLTLSISPKLLLPGNVIAVTPVRSKGALEKLIVTTSAGRSYVVDPAGESCRGPYQIGTVGKGGHERHRVIFG